MITAYYRCLLIRNNEIVLNHLRQGRFLSDRHYHNLLAYWSGHINDNTQYVYYPVLKMGNGEPPDLLDHVHTMPHLAGLSHGYPSDAWGREGIYS